MKKKKILILGVTGMLGHKLYMRLSKKDHYFVTGSCRAAEPLTNYLDQPEYSRIYQNIDAFDFDSIVRVFSLVQPDVVINCIGIIKQLPIASDPIIAIGINSLFPHRLYQLCKASKTRLIHISTDCVFSGSKGCYVENDSTDAEDLYGKSKALGEVHDEGALTIRTSIIGRELCSSFGLVEWFLNNEGKTVKGYKNAVFSGFTTIALSDIVEKIIDDFPELGGMWHIAAQPINKYELLSLIKEIYKLKINIEADDSVKVDRSLNAGRFKEATGFIPPPWSDMITHMHQDATPYDKFRKDYVHR